MVMWICTYTEFQVGERQGGLPADTLFIDHSHHYTITKSFVLSKHLWQSLIFLFNICVLLRLLMLCWNSTAKETWGRRVYLAYASIVLFIIKGTHDRNSNRGDSETWSQKRMHRPWRRSPLWFLIVTCSSCSLIECRTIRTWWHYPRQNRSLPINTN